MRAVASSLLLDWPVLNMVLGVTIGGFAAYGFYAFIPPYFSRAFALDYATIGVIAGLSGGVAVGIGIFAGGFIADFLAQRDADGMRWCPRSAASPPSRSTWPRFYSATGGWRRDCCPSPACANTPRSDPRSAWCKTWSIRRRRATATAVLYICLNVIALGGGPLFTGWMIDRFAPAQFHGFAASCPGGAALPTATIALKSACASALAQATRRGLLVTILFFAWACAHYFLAAAGIARSLRAAALRNAAVADA